MSKSSTNLVAYCGIYRGACGQYQKELRMGCISGGGHAPCLVRLCDIEKNYRACAEYDEYVDYEKFSNYRNRKDNITAIREIGLEKRAVQAATSGDR